MSHTDDGIPVGIDKARDAGNEGTETVPGAGASGDVRSLYERSLAPLALRGLRGMWRDDEGLYCQTAWRAADDGTLPQQGLSLRYTVMTLIGLASWQRSGGTCDVPVPEASWDKLVAWGTDESGLGDAGLVLWALVLRGDERAEEVISGVLERKDSLLGGLSGFQSMSLGCFLAGAGGAVGAGRGNQRLQDLAGEALARLLANQSRETGLFCVGDRPGRRNLLRARINTRLGSFASQVYPCVGLSTYGAACDAGALAAAVRCADRLCQLQGPQGQWWWIYDACRARAVIRYPVYGVHQDAMGPMALLAVRQARGRTTDYETSLAKSLAWLGDHPECPDQPLVDNTLGVVWRAVQRDDPSRTGGHGLGLGERIRMNWAAWSGRADRRSFAGGFVCPECRPYHLGWILLAAAMLRDEGGGPR